MRRVLVPEFIPSDTPHRDEQAKALEMYFQGVVEHSERMSQNVLLSGPIGCHRKGQLVLMFDGSLKRVEDVTQGDLLMGPDSGPRKVLETVQGFGKMVEVQPIKGSAVCSLRRPYSDSNTNSNEETPTEAI